MKYRIYCDCRDISVIFKTSHDLENFQYCNFTCGDCKGKIKIMIDVQKCEKPSVLERLKFIEKIIGKYKPDKFDVDWNQMIFQLNFVIVEIDEKYSIDDMIEKHFGLVKEDG